MKNTASHGEMPYSKVGDGGSAAAAGALEGNFGYVELLEGFLGVNCLSKLHVSVNVI